MPTRAEVLRGIAREMRAEAVEHRAKADELEDSAERIEQEAEREEGKGLSRPLTTGKLAGDVDASARAELSRAFPLRKGEKANPLTTAARSAGLSLRALAERVGVPHSYLSQMAKGDRPVTAKVRDKVKALTGWDGWPR